jgi:DNA adenine methylase
MCHPFLKWAGGKRQLLPTIKTHYPFDSGYTKYVEPFIGGGAVLFDVLETQPVEEIYISDINENLINTYIVIKKYVDDLIKELKVLAKDYSNMDIPNKQQFFINRRIDYNNTKNVLKANKYIQVRQAARMIFLNRTCFNGLYRVNSKGEFNVSFGKYENPMICDEHNLRRVSSKLANVNIKCCSYQDSLKVIDDKTFVFIDPPYRPLTTSSNFNSYNKDSFGDDEQIHLAEFVRKIDKIGAKFIVCNSDPHNVDPSDDFFDDLYKGFNITRIPATRMINSKASARGHINELLITN